MEDRLTEQEAEVRLLRLAARALDDASWVLTLPGDDAPPLFNRIADIDFMVSLPVQSRLSVLLRVGVELLSRVRRVVEAQVVSEEMFAAITLSDWDDVVAMEQTVPTLAVLVVPRASHVGWEFREPLSPEGRWIQRIARDIRGTTVAEAVGDPVHRIYVGISDQDCQRFRSVRN